jgi:hypothetical protein
MTKSYDSSILEVLRNCQTVFPSGFTILCYILTTKGRKFQLLNILSIPWSAANGRGGKRG